MQLRYSLLLVGLMVTALACEQGADPTDLAQPLVQQAQPLEYWINTSTSSRFIPSHAERVPDPQRNDDMRNWTGGVYRGMPAKVVATQGEWKRVVYRTDATGWMLESELVPRTDASEATTLKELKTYAEADFGQPDETLTIPAGTLLFILEEANELSYVNYEGQKTAWVETALLTKEANELKVAQLIYKAEWIATVLEGPNGRVLDKARIKYPKAKLLDSLANHIDFKDFSEKPVMPTVDLAKEGLPSK